MITDDRMMTSIPGLFAAGDLRVQLTRQVTTAVGDATTAAIAVEKYLKDRQRGVRRGQGRCLSWRSWRCPTGSSPRTATWWPTGAPARRSSSIPGEEPAMFLAELDTRGWTLRAIWLTHAHIDHIMGVGAVQAGHRRADPSASARPADLRRAAPVRRLGRHAARAAAAARRRAAAGHAGPGRPVRVRGALHAGPLAGERELRRARHGVRRRRAVQRLGRPHRPAGRRLRPR